MQAGMTMEMAGAFGVGMEDEALVRELKAGSEGAFAVLIAQYHQSLYALISRSLQDPADAADITQEVFIKVFRGIGSFHGDSSLRTWLYRIALREASNQRRWWSRHKRQELTIDTSPLSPDADSDADGDTLGDRLADGRDSPFDTAAHGQTRARVEAALQQLPEAYRTVVILREMEGMAYDEIAEILDIQLGTVKSRLMRGRAALRTVLVETNEAESQRQALAREGALAPVRSLS